MGQTKMKGLAGLIFCLVWRNAGAFSVWPGPICQQSGRSRAMFATKSNHAPKTNSMNSSEDKSASGSLRNQEVEAIIEFSMRRPNLDVDRVAERIAALHELLPNSNIRDLLRRQPTLLDLDPASVIAPNLRNLTALLNAKDSPGVVERVVRHAPSLLAYEPAVLERKLRVLSDVVFDLPLAKTADLVATRAPGLLTLSIDDNILPSFGALQTLLSPSAAPSPPTQPLLAQGNEELPPSGAALEEALEAVGAASTTAAAAEKEAEALAPVRKLLQRAPTLLGYANHTLKSKVRRLRQVLGPDMTLVELGKVVTLAPALLTLDMETNVLPKVRALQLLFARTAPLPHDGESGEGDGKTTPANTSADTSADASADTSDTSADTAAAAASAAATRQLAARRLVGGTGGVLNSLGLGGASERRRSGSSKDRAGRYGGGLLGKPVTKTGSILSSALRLKMLSAISASADETDMDETDGDGSAGGGSSAGVSVVFLLPPMLPRAEVVRMISQAPTLLQRNVGSSLAPKLKLLRRLMPAGTAATKTASSATSTCTNSSTFLTGPADDPCGVAASPSSSSTLADDLVRSKPRLLLSSAGVLGRVAFVRAMRQEEQGAASSVESAAAAAAAAASTGVDALPEETKKPPSGGQTKKPRRRLSSLGNKDEEENGGDQRFVSAVKAAVMAPRAKFFAAHHPRYEEFLVAAVAGPRGGGTNAIAIKMSHEKLEKTHGELLLLEL